MEEYCTASSEGKRFLRDAYIIQQFPDLGMGQASMRWGAVPRKVYKDALRLALQRQVAKHFSCVATNEELMELKSNLGVSGHHLLCGPRARTGRRRPRKKKKDEQVEVAQGSQLATTA